MESNTNPRRGDWVQTFSKKRVYPLDPRPEDICIEDIAHALSNQCRFAGHTKHFISVGQHSVLVSRLCPEPYKLWGLLHDASEAYLMDIPSPFKYLPEMATYRTFEAGMQYIIYLKFGLLGPEPPEVKAADKLMLTCEATDLLSPLLPGWDKWIERLDISLISPFEEDNLWFPEFAEDKFLYEFEALTKAKH